MLLNDNEVETCKICTIGIISNIEPISLKLVVVRFSKRNEWWAIVNGDDWNLMLESLYW